MSRVPTIILLELVFIVIRWYYLQILSPSRIGIEMDDRTKVKLKLVSDAAERTEHEREAHQYALKIAREAKNKQMTLTQSNKSLAKKFAVWAKMLGIPHVARIYLQPAWIVGFHTHSSNSRGDSIPYPVDVYVTLGGKVCYREGYDLSGSHDISSMIFNKIKQIEERYGVTYPH